MATTKTTTNLALNPAFAASGTTIFATMSALAAERGCVNLGQGFPDVDGPGEIKRAAAEHLLSRPQQYAPAGGIPELRAAIAEHSRVHSGLPLGSEGDGGKGSSKSDGSNNVVVTAGATEALAAAILGVVAPGDKVVLLDPSYDSYAPMVRAAGAEPVALALRPPTTSTSTSSPESSPSSASSSWSLPPREELERALGDRTKMMIVNSPHNPTGKVFAMEELETIAEIVREKDPEGTKLFLLLDEVYQHLVHPKSNNGNDGEKEQGGGEQQQQQQKKLHVSLATLPGMAQRSIRVGSAGKTFSLTGFKVGWATSSSAELAAATFRAHQFLTFCVPPSLQAGVAAGFERESSYFLNLGAELAEKRERLAGWIEKAGFVPLPAEGTYFLVADAAALMLQEESDSDFCVRLARDGGVAAIPLSALYADRGHAPRTLVRFCFCKKDEVLDEGGRRLVAFWEKSRK